MKIRNSLVIAMALMVLLSCVMPGFSPEQNAPTFNWPLDGVIIEERTAPNVDVLTGTYEKRVDYSFETELISFKGDGTLVSVPFQNLYSYSRFPRTEGTWSYDEEQKTIKIIIGDKTIEEKVQALINRNTNKKIGFGYYDANKNQIKYEKISDAYIDLSIYNDKTIEGLFATKDDYEDVYGWEFRKDGTAISHTKDRNSFKHNYRTNPDKALLKIIDSMGLSEDYNYCLLDGYLYLNGKPYQKIR